jgi:sulfotransferase
MKKIYFISGQTRSGSELLCNILAQNPKFRTGTTSAIVDVISSVRNLWNDFLEFKATPNEEGKTRVLKGILQSYYPDDFVYFDKSRAWLAYLEMSKDLLDHEVKVLVPIRDMKQVLSSWEKLYRKNAHNRYSNVEQSNYIKAQTTKGRAEILLQENEPVGIAHNRIVDALQRGWHKNLFFVDYDDLTKSPKEVMVQIYDFLGEEWYEHDFNNVKQTTQSNDDIFGFKDLHKIRKEVKPQKEDWKEVLGDWAEDLNKYNFWRNNK